MRTKSKAGSAWVKKIISLKMESNTNPEKDLVISRLISNAAVVLDTMSKYYKILFMY